MGTGSGSNAARVEREEEEDEEEEEEEEEERLFIANALRRRRRRRKVYSKLTQRRDGWAAVCLEVLMLHALLLLPLRCRCSVKRSRQKSI